MSTPLVSVIIPAFNVEDFIRPCLDSVLGQTLQDIEVICVDDGSTDGTGKILREYEEKDPRVRVLTQDNRGAGAARNLGLQEAKGETLSFLDGDDFFEPDMLETAYRKLKETRAQFVVFDSDVYFEDTKEFYHKSQIKYNAIPPYEPFHRRSVTDNVFRIFIGWAWDKLYDAEFIRSSGLRFQEIRTTNDMYFVFSALVISERIAVIHRELAHHRKNVQSSLSNTREKSWDCFYQALCKVRETLVSRDIYYELEQDFVNYCLHSCLWNLNSLKGDAQKKLYQMLKEKGLRELGLTDRDPQYFYNAGDCEKLIRMQKMTYEQYFEK